MKRKNISLTIIPLVLSMLFSFNTFLMAAPFYAGKVLTIIVGSAPGGGFNNMARLLAQYLPKYIPGKPTIIIQNMPGASGVIAANYVYNIAKPNGLTIGAIQSGNVLGQLGKDPGVKFDLTKFQWIGSSAIEPCVLTFRSDWSYKDFESLMKAKHPIYLAVSGASGRNTIFIYMLKAFVLPNIETVAYPSNAEIFLAIQRKEVDGTAGAYFSLKQIMEQGVVRPYLRGSIPVEELKSMPKEIKSTPVDEDFTKDPTAKTLMAIRSRSDIIGRPYVAPPGTPAEPLKILREALAKATNDSALIEDAKKNLMQIKYVSAEECYKNTKFILSQPSNIVKEFVKYAK